MAKTVNGAFNTFMQNYVNLDKGVVEKARKSRDNLLDNIKDFNKNNEFFRLCSDFNIQFGSFARKTKCRPLNDIDLMVGISADGAVYDSANQWDNITLYASDANDCQMQCANSNGSLNSTLVLNRFKKELEKLPEYQHSEIKRNHEAIVLNLISKDWSFDIVPCFFTKPEVDGRTFYLIPNGKGNWKKTDPRIDKDRISKLRKTHGNAMLDAIRLFKYWNKYANTCTIDGYISECLLLQYFELNNNDSELKFLFYDLLLYVRNNIYFDIQDPKGIQGNINNLSFNEKSNIQTKVDNIIYKANEALRTEIYDNNTEKAINIWRNIFGEDFPKYE